MNTMMPDPSIQKGYDSLQWADADRGCETFLISQTYKPSYRQETNGKLFSFCKTRGLEYDTAVTACLIVLNHYLGDDMDINSDGDTKDWQDGLKACQECLGYGKIPNSIRQ